MPRTKPPTDTRPASTRTIECAECAEEFRNTHRALHEHGTECPALRLYGEHRFAIRLRDDKVEADTAAAALVAVRELAADHGDTVVVATVMDNVRGRYLNGPELDAEARAIASFDALKGQA